MRREDADKIFARIRDIELTFCRFFKNFQWMISIYSHMNGSLHR